MKKSIICFALGMVLFPLTLSAQNSRWYKGNTHCHTTNSDGDESPRYVVQMSQLQNVKLFELYNLSYNCNNFGAGGSPEMEEIWDRMLSKGIVMYGIASDDAHEYRVEIQKEDDMKYTTQFIGKNGQLLEEIYGTTAVYTFKGREAYVQTRVFASSSEFACTQPVFLNTDKLK